MKLHKRIANAPWVRTTIGVMAAEYLRFVWKTSRVVVDPPDFFDRITDDLPIIAAMWHGQHFMMPFANGRRQKVKVLISRHRDGDVNAIAAERLGIGTIRGSGDHERRFDRKGGVSAFKSMLSALNEGCHVAVTADVPKVSRVAGRGIVMLARASGRPIYPVIVATSRRYEMGNWDRSAVSLPFSRGAVVSSSEPIWVPPDADDAAVEAARVAVETALNRVTERAYAIVDRKSSKSNGHDG